MDTNTVILLEIVFPGRIFKYSDINRTIKRSRRAPEFYSKGLLEVGTFNKSVDFFSGKASIGNVTVKLANVDRLQDVFVGLPFSSAVVNFYQYHEDDYDNPIFSMSGRMDGVDWNYNNFSFTIKEDVNIFLPVPPAEYIFDENSLQEVFMLKEPSYIERFEKSFWLSSDQKINSLENFNSDFEFQDSFPGWSRYGNQGSIDVKNGALWFILTRNPSLISLVPIVSYMYYHGGTGNEVDISTDMPISLDILLRSFNNYTDNTNVSNQSNLWIKDYSLDSEFKLWCSLKIYFYIDDENEFGIEFLKRVNPGSLSNFDSGTVSTAYQKISNVVGNLTMFNSSSFDNRIFFSKENDTNKISIMDLNNTKNFNLVSETNNFNYDTAKFRIKLSYYVSSNWWLTPPTSLWVILDNFRLGFNRGVIHKIRDDRIEEYNDDYFVGSRIDVIDDTRINSRSNDDRKEGESALGNNSFIRLHSGNELTLPILPNRVRQNIDIEGSPFPSNTMLNAGVTSTFQITRRGIPEGSDSVGKVYPIVYGRVEKLEALWVIGTKSSVYANGSGDDAYILAGHPIYDENSKNITVWSGLNSSRLDDPENPKLNPFSPEYLENPFPKISLSRVTGNLIEDNPPYYYLFELTDKRGVTISGIRLRGNEYPFERERVLSVTDEDGNVLTETLPLAWDPQYSIRNGLGSEKVYCDFNGYADDDGSVTGFPETLIQNPADVLLHFLKNYTKLGEESTSEFLTFNETPKINYESFRKVKSVLNGWKFNGAITEQTSGEEFVERLTNQFRIGWYFEDGQFSISFLDINAEESKFSVSENKEIIENSINFKESNTSNIYNEIIIKYKYDYPSKENIQIVRRDATNSQKCRTSQQKYGITRRMEFDAPDITEPYTANQLADYLVDLHHKTRIELTCELIYDLRDSIEIGDILSVSHSEGPSSDGNGWVDKLCVVTSVSRKKYTLGLNLLEI